MSAPDSPLAILLIDDDHNMLLIAQWALRLDPGITARPLSCATAALELQRDGAWRPDLVLADMSMPDMDGFALLDALAALPAASRAPLIFLTGRDRPDDIARMRSAGAIGVIPKPFEPEALARMVRERWARR